MHELSMAEALVDEVLEVAARHGLGRVIEVEIEAGALRGIVPEIMRMAFEAAAGGTLAEGARLTMVTVEASAECGTCGSIFSPRPDDYVCPSCLTANARVLRGEGLILKTVAGNPTNHDETGGR